MLDGSLTYRERIALPPDALAVIEARDDRGRLLGEATFATDGRQVPLPFSLAVPQDTEATLRAAIIADSQPRWFTADVPVPAGTEPYSLGEVVLRQVIPLGLSTTLRCGDRELRIGFFGETALLELDGERIPLELSGLEGRYAAPDDAGTWILTRANRARVSINGNELPECSVVPPGAPKAYVARGNEPGWTLTFEDGRMTLVTDYGERRIEAAQPEARYQDGSFVYAVPSDRLEVRVTRELCRDDMTGMPYPDRVSISLEDRTLGGCGGETLDLLKGGEWVVEDLGGRGIIDASRMTLVFAEDGQLGGLASCNRYATSIQIGGESLTVGPIAATQMLCAEALMEQERGFFAALASVGRIDFDETGALLLYDPASSEPAITARR